MRLWHLVYFIGLIGVGLGLSRDPVGRVAVIVFLTGLGEVAMGTTALLLLFRTVGALGEARRPAAYAEALAATAAVLAGATLSMVGWLFAGSWLLTASLD